MKIAGLVLTLLLAWINGPVESPASKTGKDAEIDAKTAKLLSKMTLEEKVGQMTQVTIDVVADLDRPKGGYQKLDPAKLRKAIVEKHVGSILNVMNSAYTVENWHDIITQIQDVATKETRLSIPIIYGVDAIHGANYTVGATIFPQSLGMAATWNVDLVRREGEITALETRASGIPWNFNPVLSVGRQPLWPRLWETYGEDTHLASVLGAAYIKGLEGDDNDVSQPNRVAGCIKHYIGDSHPYTGKDRTPAYIPERQLREFFLPPYKAGIDAGVHTLMINSGEVNGEPAHRSHFLLKQVLRDELGFKGFTVSDWEDIIRLHTRDMVAPTPKEAVRLAVMAGVDMSMVPLDFSFYDLLLELARDGDVPISRIDEAVGRILRVKFALGLFENPYPNKKAAANIGTAPSRQVALQAARESIVLTKNSDNLLPLRKGARILVTGPTADKLTSLNSGWTITWQGNDESLYPRDRDTILKALQKKFGPDQVSYVPGTDFDKEIDIAAAVEAARNAEVAIICAGEPAYCESVGNIGDLSLPDAQLELVRAVAKTGTPVVLVLAEGRPCLINRVEPEAGAVLVAFLPGMEGGTAIADILAGDFNPSGKLPVTYPRYPNDLTLYDHKNSENFSQEQSYHPQWPFGYGLSYTTFAYSKLTLSKQEINNGDSIVASVVVTNTGSRAGQEVVQLYLRDMYASVTPSVRRLKAFQKIELQPGESKEVSFTLQEQDLAFIGTDNKLVVEPGEFQVHIGGLQQAFVLR